MEKNSTPIDLSQMPLTPPSPVSEPPVAPAPQAPTAPAAPLKPAPVMPDIPEPQLSHESHNGGPVAPSIPPLESPPRRSLAPVLVGLIILLLLAIGIFFYFIQEKKPQTKAEKTPVITEATPVPFFLKVASPNGETDVVNGEVLVSGTTLPNTSVAIYSDIDDASVQSDADGHFESTVMVDEGGGVVKVSAYSQNGEEKSEAIQVGGQAVLGKSDARGQQNNGNGGGNSNNGTGGGNASDNGNGNAKQDIQPVRKTVSPEVVAAALKNANIREKIKAQTDPALFLKVKVKEQLAVKLGVARLKEIIANKTGSASAGIIKRIVEARTASAGATLKRHALMGVITAVTDTAITIRHQNLPGVTNDILYNANTIIQSESDKSGTGASFAVGQRINAVGYPSDQGLLATRIHIIPGVPLDVVKTFNLTPTAIPTSEVGTSSAAPVAPSAVPTVEEPTLIPTEIPTVIPTAGPATSNEAP